MKNKNISRFLALALLIGASFVSGAVASPSQAPVTAAGCQKIIQGNGTWIGSVCPVAGQLGNKVVGVDVYYWGYLVSQELPFGGATPTVQAYIKNDAGRFINTPLRRDSNVYLNSPANGSFLSRRYLTTLPGNGTVDLELYFEFNGREDSDFGRNYVTRLGF